MGRVRCKHELYLSDNDVRLLVPDRDIDSLSAQGDENRIWHNVGVSHGVDGVRYIKIRVLGGDNMNLFEEVEKIKGLSSDITNNKWINHDAYGFSREYEFTVRGVRYIIECWANMGYLLCGELKVPFHTFRFDGTWPNNFKNCLQFNYFNKVCAILPVEEYTQG